MFRRVPHWKGLDFNTQDVQVGLSRRTLEGERAPQQRNMGMDVTKKSPV